MNNYRPQRSCEGYVFTGRVCLSTGGGVSAPEGMSTCEGSAPGGDVCSRGGGVWSGEGVCLGGGSGRGVGIPACTKADPPHPWERRLLLRTVRILLECILVLMKSIFRVCSHWQRPRPIPIKWVWNPLTSVTVSVSVSVSVSMNTPLKVW